MQINILNVLLYRVSKVKLFIELLLKIKVILLGVRSWVEEIPDKYIRG
jgi:hypothetical protein